MSRAFVSEGSRRGQLHESGTALARETDHLDTLQVGGAIQSDLHCRSRGRQAIHEWRNACPKLMAGEILAETTEGRFTTVVRMRTPCCGDTWVWRRSGFTAPRAIPIDVKVTIACDNQGVVDQTAQQDFSWHNTRTPDIWLLSEDRDRSEPSRFAHEPPAFKRM